MRNFSKLVTVFVLGLQLQSAQAEGLSQVEQAILNVGKSCQDVTFNQQRYDFAIAIGYSADKATQMGYSPADTSEFCRYFRLLLKQELKKPEALDI